ncbi:MAG: AAA family ATPase [Lachnospiraceae bacterium]|nr:AAA family ATPase [Lachnospiraceae bacterium]
MNIKRVKEEIKRTVAAYLEKDASGAYVMDEIHQRPVLLIGPPGIGKTAIMEQVARECKIGLVSYTITHHTRQSAIGLPYIETKEFGGETYRVTEYTMSEIIGSIYDKMRDTGLSEGILFIDEINCVSETLAPTMLQFLQAKTFGQHKVPAGWIICAAGNPVEYNRSVREFDVVTLDRVKKIEVDQDFDVWKEYAYQVGIHDSILAYLEIKKENFYRVETTVDGIFFVTARGWEDLSQMLYAYERQGFVPDRDMIVQYVQNPQIALDFANYLELWYKYQRRYDIAGVLAGQIPESMREAMKRAAFDERISVIGMLYGGCNATFRDIYRGKIRMGELYQAIIGFRDLMANEFLSPRELFLDVRAQKEAAYQKNRKAELLTKDEITEIEAALATLASYAYELAEVNDNQGAYAKLRALFEEERTSYDALVKLAGEQLDHAFTFIRTCFGDGQELVIFLTELARGFYSMEYLNRYGNEKFFEYNKMLLFKDREAELMEEIAAAEFIS